MNNKGFAFSTMLYGFMIIGCLIFLIILGLMSTNRTNTREMVNLIEDDSARLSLASKTITSNEEGKDYRDYDVPLGFSGWYKIELWGKGKYSATTVYLYELTIVRFFIGTGSKDTYACSSNTFSYSEGTLPTSFDTEEEAETAFNKVDVMNILTSGDCTDKNTLILSTESQGNRNFKQIGDGIAKNKDGTFSILNFAINAKADKRRNTVENITSSGNKARITYVSTNAPNNGLSEGGTDSGTICGSGNSGLYYIKDSSGFWTSTSSSNKTSTSFTGNKEQKWLIKCTYVTPPASPSCSATNIKFNNKPSFSCDGKTFYNAGF